MPRPTVAHRIEVLEQKVTALEALPGKIDDLAAKVASQGMRIDALAAKVDFQGTKIDALVVRVDEVEKRLKGQILQLGTDLRLKMAAMHDGLREEIRGGDEETRRYMRVLHEDLVGRISTLGERWNLH